MNDNPFSPATPFGASQGGQGWGGPFLGGATYQGISRPWNKPSPLASQGSQQSPMTFSGPGYNNIHGQRQWNNEAWNRYNQGPTNAPMGQMYRTQQRPMMPTWNVSQFLRSLFGGYA